MELRWYQLAAREAVYEHLRTKDTNPCVVMPTGSGKSPLIAQIASDSVTRWKGRVLCLAHRKELLQQNAEKLHFFAPDLDHGIYSAGLKSRDTQHSVIFAGIQSVYHRAEELGHFDIVIVDEAHLIPDEGQGMYQTFLRVAKAVNPHLRVIGMTATPYRMKTGTICTEGGILNEICYEAPIVPLVNQGFLTKLVSRAGAEKAEINTQGVKTIGGEFHSSELEIRATEPAIMTAAVDEILTLTKKRSKVLLFCSGVAHAREIEGRIFDSSYYFGHAATIVGDTPAEKRAHLLSLYRKGDIKFLINVGVYTEGLDVPDIDCIVLLRPTQSIGLYVQMVGRGLRVAEGKKDCMILDYGGNVLRHGPIDEINLSRVMRDRKKRDGEEEIVAKKCPSCSHLISAGYGTCPYCGFEFPLPEPELDSHASDEAVMDRKQKVEWCKVTNVSYELWRKSSGKPGPPTLRVNYNISFYQSISEWVCLEHEAGTFPWKKARDWWLKRVRDDLSPMPLTIQDAMAYIQRHGLKEPARIYIKFARTRDEFNRIEDFEFPLNTGELLSDINANLTKPDQDVEVPF